MSAMFIKFSLKPAKNALAYSTTSIITSGFPCIPHPFTHVDRSIETKAMRSTNSASPHGDRSARQKPASQNQPGSFRLVSQEYRLALTHWASARTLGKPAFSASQAESADSRITRFDCCLEPRQTGACGAEARMHGLKARLPVVRLRIVATQRANSKDSYRHRHKKIAATPNRKHPAHNLPENTIRLRFNPFARSSEVSRATMTWENASY